MLFFKQILFMKKFHLLSALMAAALPAMGQVTVTETGQMQLGMNGSLSTVNPGLAGPEKIGGDALGDWMLQGVPTDSVARLTMLGTGYRHNGGRISFGDGDKVCIGELYGKSTDTDILLLNGASGLRYTDKDGVVFKYSPASAAMFNTDLSVQGLGIMSDEKQYEAVSTFEDGGKALSCLTPVTYTLKGDASGRARIGVLATEVEKIFPELVYTDAEKKLTVDYAALTAVLIEAVNELRATVEAQSQMLEAYSQGAQHKAPGTASVDEIEAVTASMAQNRPNPFTESTVIEVCVPQTVRDAFVCVYDLQGRQLMRMEVEERGQSAVTLSGETLPAGMYIYTLITDGQDVATHRMILTD